MRLWVTGALAPAILLTAAAFGLAAPARSAPTCRPGFAPIPMTALPSGHHSVSVMLNGKAAVFLVDTGAGATIIHTPYLARFALSRGAGAGTATNPTGKLRFDPVAVKGFAVGGTKTRLDKIYAMDISYLVDAVSAASSQRVEGLVGQDVLRDQKAIVDLDQSILYLADPDSTCPDAHGPIVAAIPPVEPRNPAL
ncbi:MAG TPA: retroviral-like aspartic protease family protein [Allosphingosinicella sp.]|nr:retroviral-like aspartic protease family protein [Allosphingosinicella sp.]